MTDKPITTVETLLGLRLNLARMCDMASHSLMPDAEKREIMQAARIALKETEGVDWQAVEGQRPTDTRQEEREAAQQTAIKAMLAKFQAIGDGCENSEGRWLDEQGSECAEDEEGARFEEFTASEQVAWLETCHRLALEGIAAGEAAPVFYYEVNLYGFKRESDGTTALENEITDLCAGFCVYVMKRDTVTDDPIDDIYCQDFTDFNRADAVAEAMLKAFSPDGEVNVYSMPHDTDRVPLVAEAWTLFDEAVERGREGNDVEQYTNECMLDTFRDLMANGKQDVAAVLEEIVEAEIGLDFDYEMEGN